jgi:hypothetical protein
MTLRPGTLSRGAFAAALAAAACLAAPVAGAGAQAPPDTRIDLGPSGPTNTAEPEFTFSSLPPGAATFQCWDHRPDDTSESFSDCMSPRSLGPLDEGPWVFEVRAVTSDGPDPTPARAAFTVDLTPPDTTITSEPARPTAMPVFAFTSSDSTAAFECWRHRQGEVTPAFAPCISGAQLPPLGDGEWVFEVRAFDPAGNRDPNPEVRNFSVDATAPNTTIVSGPAGLSNDATPDFAFMSNEAGGFACRLHRVGQAVPAPTPCGPTYSPGPLADGAYVLEVAAVDAAGNTDVSPASTAFSIDTVPPQTGITGGPGDTTAATAVFLFSAPGAAGFSCRLDGGAWQACASPHTYPTLSLGPHRFEVAAVDAAGNQDPTPAQHAWQVLRPGRVIPGAVEQAIALARELVQMRRALARIRLRRLARRPAITLRTFDALTAGTVRVRARTLVRRGRSRRWIGVITGKREVPDAGRHRIRAKVTRKGRRLARMRQRLPLELRLSFTDLAGRSLWTSSKVTLRR